jgi:hypothetical protein
VARITGAFHGAIATTTPRRPDAHRQLARHIGGDHVADEPVRLGGGFAQHPGGQLTIEHAPAEHAAGLLGHDTRDLGSAFEQQLGRLQQDRPPQSERAARPFAERGVRSVHRRTGILPPAAAAVPTAVPSYGKPCS